MLGSWWPKKHASFAKLLLYRLIVDAQIPVRRILVDVQVVIKLRWPLQVPRHDAWVAEGGHQEHGQYEESQNPAANAQWTEPIIRTRQRSWHNKVHVVQAWKYCHDCGGGDIRRLSCHESASKAHSAIASIPIRTELVAERVF